MERTRTTRKRPSTTQSQPTIAPAIDTIKRITSENQAIVNAAVTSILTDYAKDDAAIVREIMAAASPLDRLARIVSQVSVVVPAGSGTESLIEALDSLRYALRPEMRLLPSEKLAEAFKQPETLDLKGRWTA